MTLGRHVISTGDEHFVAQSSPTLDAVNAGPRFGPVVINEIMYRPADLADGADNSADEFIELLNVSGTSVLLYDSLHKTNTWKLTGGVDFTFPTNRSLGNGEFLLLVNFDPASNAAQLASFRTRFGLALGVPIFGPYSGNLANDAGEVELKKPATPVSGAVPFLLVDKVSYRDSAPWPGGADGYGLSLQRRVSTAYGNDPANWVAALPSAAAASPSAGSVPILLAQPQSQTLLAFGHARLSVMASDVGPLRYQWRLNGVNLPGATNGMLFLTNLQPQQSGDYAVLVMNAAGSAVSSNAALSLLFGAAILAQPQHVGIRGSTNAADYGSTTNRSATFSVSASSFSPIGYQWRFNDVAIPGATSPALTVNNVTLAEEGFYDVVLTDSIGSLASSPARLSVLLTPIILQPPVSQTVVAGRDVSLSVAISGNPTPFRYEWRRGITPLSVTPESQSRTNFVTLNTTAAGFLLASNVPSANFTCRIVITNEAFPAPGVSTTFTLTVLADSDGDGLSDFWEQTHFGNSLAADANADGDGDGMLNWEEQRAGTDPANPLSYLKVDSITSSGVTTLTFGAVSNRTYAVQFTKALDPGAWSDLVAVPARSNNWTTVVTDPTPATNRFYRLVTPHR